MTQPSGGDFNPAAPLAGISGSLFTSGGGGNTGVGGGGLDDWTNDGGGSGSDSIRYDEFVGSDGNVYLQTIVNGQVKDRTYLRPATPGELKSAGYSTSSGSGSGGSSAIDYGSGQVYTDELGLRYQLDSRGQRHYLPAYAQPQTPEEPSAPDQPNLVFREDSRGNLVGIDPVTGQVVSTVPGFGTPAALPQASPSLNLNSGLSALAKAFTSVAGGGGSSSGVDPNIQARQDAEIAILNKRFELDRELSLLDFELKKYLAQVGLDENAKQRAIQAAQAAAQNRIDIYQLQEQQLQRQLEAANLFSQQISDVNPARFNAFLKAGGGVISNALSGGETALDDLAILPSAMSLQSIRTPLELPAPFDPMEFMGSLGTPQLPASLGDQLFGTPAPAGTGTGAGATGEASSPSDTGSSGPVNTNASNLTAAQTRNAFLAQSPSGVGIGPDGQAYSMATAFVDPTRTQGGATNTPLPFGPFLPMEDANALTALGSGGLSNQDLAIMGLFNAGSGMTDQFAKDIAFQNAQRQLQQYGINASLSDIQSVLAQGADPKNLYWLLQQGYDISQHVPTQVTPGFEYGVSPPSNFVQPGSVYDSNTGLTGIDPATGQFLGTQTYFGNLPAPVPPPAYARGTKNAFMRDPQVTPMGTTVAQAYVAGEGGEPELIEKTPFGDRVTPFSQLGERANAFARQAPRFAEGTITYRQLVDPATGAVTWFNIANSTGKMRYAEAVARGWQPPAPAPPPVEPVPPPTDPPPPPAVVPPAGSTGAGGAGEPAPVPEPVPDPAAPPVQNTGIDLNDPTVVQALANLGIDPATFPNLAQYQPLIDEIRQIRESTVIPDIGIKSIFDPKYFLTYPTQRNAFLAATQTAKGIPAADYNFEAEKYRIPGFDFAGLSQRR